MVNYELVFCVSILAADVAVQIKWSEHVRHDGSSWGVVLQLRPQSQCHLRSSVSSLALVFLNCDAFMLKCRHFLLLTQQLFDKLV